MRWLLLFLGDDTLPRQLHLDDRQAGHDTEGYICASQVHPNLIPVAEVHDAHSGRTLRIINGEPALNTPPETQGEFHAQHIGEEVLYAIG